MKYGLKTLIAVYEASDQQIPTPKHNFPKYLATSMFIYPIWLPTKTAVAIPNPAGTIKNNKDIFRKIV